MPNPVRVRPYALALVVVCCGTLPVAAAGPPARSLAQLLADRARDHGLTRPRPASAADRQHVRTLLRAAVRMDPQHADAWAWLYEVALLEGDSSAADEALAGLLRAAPQHEGAFEHWLENSLRGRPTAEQRVRWLEELAAAGRPPALEAQIQERLARLALERLDRAAARQHAARALALQPGSPAAAALQLEALPDDAPLAERVAALLQLLSARPLALAAVWDAALLLDESGLREEAGRLFDYGLAMHAAVHPGVDPPGGFLLDAARSQLVRGRLESAIATTQRAVRTAPTVAAQAALFEYYLLRRAGRDLEAVEVQGALARRFAAIREPSEHPVSELAQAAWYYVTLDQQPDRALMLARAARERAPSDPFVQRVLGWALAANLKADEALAVLTPLAKSDPFAAVQVARLRRAAGDAAGAARVLSELEYRPPAGYAADLLAELEGSPADGSATASDPSGTADVALKTTTTRSVSAASTDLGAPWVAATQPAEPLRPGRTESPSVTLPAVVLPPPAPVRPAQPDPAVAAMWARFDTRILDYYRQPSQFLEAAVEPEHRSPGPGEPWWVEFRLTNRGPVPLALGADEAANPVFLVSVTLEGERRREYPALLTVTLDAVRVLQPGQTTRVRRTLDVGPLRDVSRRTPQQLQRVIMNTILDAQCGVDGVWRASPVGQLPRTVYFNRVPALSARESVSSLVAALGADDEAARWRALEVLADLLGEQQRAARQPLGYTPAPIAAERVQATLLDALAAPAWETRARALDALMIAGLDRRLLDAVQANMTHPEWVVRLLALRVLARQGPPFIDSAREIARTDADELVRALAASYVATWANDSSGNAPIR